MESLASEPRKFWKVCSWARKKAKKIRESDFFPALKTSTGTMATSAQDKARTLQQECFPPPPEVDLGDLEHARYPQAREDEGEVRKEELGGVVWGLKPDKAPGPDEVVNRVVKLAVDTLQSEIERLATACLSIGYHPREFRTAITVVLRKPGKPDYSDPAAYRPIALLNTLGKIIESIVARRLSRLAEDHKLLPETQYGARPGRSTEDALLNLQEEIRAHWARKKGTVVSILSLDVSKAFDRVSHQRLLHILRMKRIPTNLVKWIGSFLEDRRTAMKVGNYTSPEEAVQVGIPQGSPLSPILYLFYTAELVQNCQQPKYNATATAFVDDTNILVYGSSAKDNCRKLKQVHKSCERWARKHGSSFNVSKYQLLHLARGKADLKAPLLLGEKRIEPSSSLRLLGVHLDSKLSGKAHVKAVQDRAPALIAALKTISGSVWGTSVQQTKQMYCQAVRPALTYGAVAWFTPDDATGKRKGVARKLQAIQGRCLRAVAGAYRATSTEALEAELGVLPLDIHVGTLAASAAARNELGEAGAATRAKVRNIFGRRMAGSRRRKQEENHQTPRSTMIARVKLDTGISLKLSEREREARATQSREIQESVKAALKKRSKDRWKDRWKEGTKGTHSRSLQPSLQARIPRLHKGLRKPQSAMVIQLRIGKIGFRSFLYHRKVLGVEDLNYSYGSGAEIIVKHILLNYRDRKDLRE
jgi:retron-type reverse transcriptase